MVLHPFDGRVVGVLVEAVVIEQEEGQRFLDRRVAAFQLQRQQVDARGRTTAGARQKRIEMSMHGTAGSDRLHAKSRDETGICVGYAVLTAEVERQRLSGRGGGERDFARAVPEAQIRRQTKAAGSNNVEQQLAASGQAASRGSIKAWVLGEERFCRVFAKVVSEHAPAEQFHARCILESCRLDSAPSDIRPDVHMLCKCRARYEV